MPEGRRIPFLVPIVHAWSHRLRRALTLGLWWGLLWGLVGLAVLVAVGPEAADVPFPLFWGALGTGAGTLFALPLARWPQLLAAWSVWRGGAVGAAAGAGLGLLAAPVAPLDAIPVLISVLALAGGASAALTVAVARGTPEPREALDAPMTPTPLPTAASARQGLRQGLTIIELVVLLTIVGLVIVAFGRFAPGPSPHALVEGAADRLNIALTAARTEAAAAGQVAVLVMPQRGDLGVNDSLETVTLETRGAGGRWLTLVVRDSGTVNAILPTATAPTGGAIPYTRGWEYLLEGVRFGSGNATTPPLPGLELRNGSEVVPSPILCASLCATRTPTGNPGYEVVYFTHEENLDAVAAVVISHAGPSFLLRWSPATQTWK